jgi:16S rRNA (cytidine1402-2'-O)-methyltransferase
MGTLYIVSTPIGNLEDITLRALKTLFTADVIACEDTRRTGQLLANYETKLKNGEINLKNLHTLKKPRLISFYDEIESVKIYEIVRLLEEGGSIALVSDSGTPLISDPGYKLVNECLKRKIIVTTVPGPSSPIAALSVSGLPPNNFTFLGYLPDKSSKRIALFKNILICSRPRSIKSTYIAFEVPHRIEKTLMDMSEILGDIEIVVTRELTKVHEEIVRGKISEIRINQTKLQGELVILFLI